MKKILELKAKNIDGNIYNAGNIELEADNENAKLYFFGDIASESWQSEMFEEDKCPNDIKEFLSDLNGNEKLDIHINSGGGSVFGGLAIYNMLKRHNGEKTVYIEGVAASIASVIAMVGDKIFIPENAFLMIHKPLSGLCGWYNSSDLRKEADTLDICQKSIMSIYKSRLKENIDISKIESMVNAETWLLGIEAEKYFNVETVPMTEIAAAGSRYFNNYINMPVNINRGKISNDTKNRAFNLNDYKDKIIDIVNEQFIKKDELEKREVEERKAKILDGLELI